MERGAEGRFEDEWLRRGKDEAATKKRLIQRDRLSDERFLQITRILTRLPLKRVTVMEGPKLSLSRKGSEAAAHDEILDLDFNSNPSNQTPSLPFQHLHPSNSLKMAKTEEVERSGPVSFVPTFRHFMVPLSVLVGFVSFVLACIEVNVSLSTITSSILVSLTRAVVVRSYFGSADTSSFFFPSHVAIP